MFGLAAGRPLVFAENRAARSAANQLRNLSGCEIVYYMERVPNLGYFRPHQSQRRPISMGTFVALSCEDIVQPEADVVEKALASVANLKTKLSILELHRGVKQNIRYHTRGSAEVLRRAAAFRTNLFANIRSHGTYGASASPEGYSGPQISDQAIS